MVGETGDWGRRQLPPVAFKLPASELLAWTLISLPHPMQFLSMHAAVPPLALSFNRADALSFSKPFSLLLLLSISASISLIFLNPSSPGRITV